VGKLQSAADLLAPVVDEALSALVLGREDQAAAALARSYARQIDEALRAEFLARQALEETSEEDPMTRLYIRELAAKVASKELLDRLGPKLLAVLESLGATPAGRARLKGGKVPDAPESKLEKLRKARSSRPA
jgi:hypothetical protein